MDRDMWEKIVLNLLSNAFKFTLEGEIIVLMRADVEQPAAILTVCDTGTGIPQDELPHIFERFHRVENARGRTHEGTGIGLALVQELVRLHGGIIEVESLLGQGTIFTVRLPFGASHLPVDRLGAGRTLASTATHADAFIEEALRWLPDETPTPVAELRPEAEVPAGDLRPRILLVEDNADMRDYVRRLLEPRYEVETAVDGEAALHAIARSRPDLVLADVMMPRVDGIALLKAVRGGGPDLRDVPVVLLSARAGEEAKVEGLEAGADDYLVKPFSAQELLARVAANVNMARLRRQVAEAVRESEALRRSEERLRESEERLRSALSIGTVGVMFWDEEGVLVDVNDAFLQMTGFTRSKALGKSWDEFTPPEFRERSAQFVEEVRSGGEGMPYEKQYYRKDGSRWWGLFTARKLTSGFVEFVLDVSARKEAEAALRESDERFRQFAASSSDVLWIRDAQTFAFEYVSPAVQKIYGVTPEAALADATLLHALIIPEEQDAVARNVERVGEGEVVVQEYRIRRPTDGSLRWIRSTGFPLFDEEGRVQRIGAIAQDITEAQLSAEHQSVLLAELQHRVRNIMAVIRSIAARTGERAGTVEEYAELMAGRLLALARVQTLLTRAANVGVGISAIIHDEVSVQAEHSGQYDLDGPDIELPPKAAEVLALAIHELGTNAVKYGALSVPNGKVTVRWSTTDRRGMPWLVFDWMEQGGPERPEVSGTPRRRGFGSELIEGRIPYELSGSGHLTIEAGGARCHLEFPLKEGASILETGAPRQAIVFGELST
jgi:PAS domain S-box-containing protein